MRKTESFLFLLLTIGKFIATQSIKKENCAVGLQ